MDVKPITSPFFHEIFNFTKFSLPPWMGNGFYASMDVKPMEVMKIS